MYKLNPENQFPLTKETLSQILQSYNISDFTFQPIHEGIANSSAVIETNTKKYVLRIYAQGRKSDENIAFEIAFQDLLRKQGIPIPLIHTNNMGVEFSIIEMNGKSWQAILMEFVEGQSVTNHPSLELITKLAQIQAKMHVIGIEHAKNVDSPKQPWIDLHDSIASKATNISANSKTILDLLERVKNYHYELNPDLVHGYNHLDIDFDGNVITNGNKVASIIDFDDLEYSPTIVCLGYTLWYLLANEGVAVMQHYLKEYEKIRMLSSIEHEALPQTMLFRNYVFTVVKLLFKGEQDAMSDIENALRLEKEIPTLKF